MSILNNIKEKAAGIILKREYAATGRMRKICNMDLAGKIGILYYLPDEATYETVSRYVKKLQDRGKTVKALGYVEQKQLAGRFAPKLSYDFLFPSGLNWFLKPQSASAKDFIDTPYDILIDLSLREIVPLRYVLALSKALFKVGLQSETKAEYLDLMIDLQNKGTLDELIAQLDHYLNELNKKNER